MSETPPISRFDAPLTVLQLDTVFPRVAGDVASPDTYQTPIAIKKIDQASVAAVVTAAPDQTNISKFEQACGDIHHGIGVTSCGFLGYWQDHLNRICPAPFIASSLVDLPHWQGLHGDGELAIVTFDDAVLSTPLYEGLRSGFHGAVIGLSPDMHLRQVISQDRPELDQPRAEQEMLDLLTPYLAAGSIKALVLECTNLPPYKAAIKSRFDVEVYDILTSIHNRDPNVVKPEFL